MFVWCYSTPLFLGLSIFVCCNLAPNTFLYRLKTTGVAGTEIETGVWSLCVLVHTIDSAWYLPVCFAEAYRSNDNPTSLDSKQCIPQSRSRYSEVEQMLLHSTLMMMAIVHNGVHSSEREKSYEVKMKFTFADDNDGEKATFTKWIMNAIWLFKDKCQTASY